MRKKNSYSRKIESIKNTYLKYNTLKKHLEDEANRLINLTALKDEIYGRINCDYFPDSGLMFIIDFEDSCMPHNIDCSLFFEIINERGDDIKKEDLVKFSY